MVVRPALLYDAGAVLLYDAECWPTKRSHLQKIKVAEMRMIR